MSKMRTSLGIDSAGCTPRQPAIAQVAQSELGEKFGECHQAMSRCVPAASCSVPMICYTGHNSSLAIFGILPNGQIYPALMRAALDQVLGSTAQYRAGLVIDAASCVRSDAA